MNKDIEDILLRKMDEEEMLEMQKCLKQENSNRITYIPIPTTVDELKDFYGMYICRRIRIRKLYLCP